MNRHLLADPELVERLGGWQLQVNPPVRAEPVIVREHKWEQVLLGLTLTVIDDGGKIRLWYGCRSSKEHSGKHTAYAESVDGTLFEKKGVVIPETMEGSTYIDRSEAPEKRYGYFGNLFGHGLFRWTSPDGTLFTRDRDPLLAFESDTQCVLLQETSRNLYVAYVRGWDSDNTKGGRRRTVMRLTNDRVDRPWSYTPSGAVPHDTRLDRLPHFHDESDVVLKADGADPAQTDVYTMAPCRYGSFWIAFPTFYRHFREPSEGRYLNGGRTAVQCVGSRDGISWYRYDRGSYAAPQMGENMVYMGQGLVQRGDEIWQYGFAYQTHHGEVEKRARVGDGTMYRFVQRKDGFVAAVASSMSSLVTRPIRTAGKLFLNLDTDGIGVTRVGLCHENGDPVPGLGLRECRPITTNSTRAEVTWDGSDLRRLNDSYVKLVIESSRTRLYSLWFE